VLFVGVDVAWGVRAGTGVCTIDESGTVLASARLATTDSIDRWISDRATDAVIVAVDAPLVVTNLHGGRTCDRMETRCFGARHAGAHACNRSMPHFANGGRAAHLADLLKLDTDPWIERSEPTRRMIEVYPHPAIVSLFGLATTIKYKAKRGRTLEARRACFDGFIGRLSSLADATPPLQLHAGPGGARFAGLVDGVAAATTGAALDRLEDELDAYVCAYVALYYWYWGAERCHVFTGDDGGFIVTPVDGLARERLACMAEQDAGPGSF
jgi:predicted RNase H-like nuclease